MFEQRQKKRPWKYTWTGIVGVVILAVAVLQIIRNNPPESVAATADPVIWSDGTIFDGSAEVGSESYLSFPIKTNRRFRLKAYFATRENKKRLATWFIKEEDFHKWKSGGEFTPLTATGLVPRATINAVFDAGDYILIFDNRATADVIKLFDCKITIE